MSGFEPSRLRARWGGRLLGAWGWVKRLWNLVRPGWPAPLFSLIACAGLLFSGQGQEVLFAIADPADPRFWTSFATLIVSSLLIYASFLVAICDYYPDYSDRALQGHFVRFMSAAGVGMIIPVALALHFAARVFGAARDANAQAALSASLLVIGILFIVFRLVRRFGMRLFVSPFSTIMVVSPPVRIAIGLFIFLGTLAAAATVSYPPAARMLGPVGVVLLGLTLWSVIAVRLVGFFERRDWLPPILAPIFLLLLVSIFGGVRGLLSTTPALSPAAQAELPAMRQHARAWLQARSGAPSDEPVRAIVVLAEGGGIRSALQSATILAELDRVSGGALDAQLYALSGVSGGAVGVSAYLAARAQTVEAARAPGPAQPASVLVDRFFREDHFSPLLAGLFFLDMPLSFWPTPIPEQLPERARLFENSFAQALAPFGDDVADVLARAWPSGATAPIFIANSVRANDGALEVVSNVRFPASAGGGDPRICNLLERVAPTRTLSLASAAHVSARFPLISPPAAIAADSAYCRVPGARVLRFVDGGYLDNSGALAAREAVGELRAAAREMQLNRPLEIVVIHIYARSIVGGQAPRPNAFLPELTAPLDALVGVRNVQGLGPVENLCRLLHEGPAADSDPCARLGGFRTLRTGDAPSRDLVGASVRPGALMWINAPLEVNEVDSADPAYVPLGWLLGRSRAYVQQQSCVRAHEIWSLASTGVVRIDNAVEADCAARAR